MTAPDEYERFKALALAVTATAVVGRTDEGLCRDAYVLAAAASPGTSADAAVALAAVARGDHSGAALDAFRSAHLAFRSEVWTQRRCEYVPCAGRSGHAHEVGELT